MLKVEILSPGEKIAPHNAFVITFNESDCNGHPVGGSQYTIPAHSKKCNNSYDALSIALDMVSYCGKPGK